MSKALLKSRKVTSINLVHLVIEGYQVCQAGPAFHTLMLAGPDPLVILHMLYDSTQEDLLHELLQH